MAGAAHGEAVVHASCVASGGRGLLILGPSGSGKSELALALMGMGAGLVADDRTILARHGESLIATCPDPLRGLIEARGVGLLRAEALDRAEVALVVDLGQRETDRLPPKRQIALLGLSLDLVLGQDEPHFPSAVLQCLRGGRQA
ncbi:MAG TPA: HPr kinase/phosphatase C-terminal domain-containing protein [Paracoccaceae bacterium]